MKKFLVIAFLFSFIGMASAQWSTPVRVPIATTDSMEVGQLTVTKYITLTAGYSTVSIQPVVTKFSGTVAGTVVLYGTVDGTNYVSTGDTLTLANVTTAQTAIWNVTPNKYYKYKIVGVGSGTMNAYLRVWYIARKTITE